MPYKKSYNRSTVGTGGSRTPKTVMGGQGNSTRAHLDPNLHNKSKSTGTTPHPANRKSSKAAPGKYNHA